MYERIAAESADEMLEGVLALRRECGHYRKPDEVNALLEIFPRVCMRAGYMLDYVQAQSQEGVVLPIVPFARPREENTWVPMIDPEEELHPEDLNEILYQYLEYEKTPAGLFEYVFFVIELRAMRGGHHASDWLEATPIFTRERFDAFVEQADKIDSFSPPEYFGPRAHLDDRGGDVAFLVHTPLGWKRIYYLEGRVLAGGHVEHRAGAIVADLGMGYIF